MKITKIHYVTTTNPNEVVKLADKIKKGIFGRPEHLWTKADIGG